MGHGIVTAYSRWYCIILIILIGERPLGQAIDKVNEYYEKCFGPLKYPTWICMTDCLLDTAPGTTLFGIVPFADNPPGNSNIVVNGIVQVEKIRNARDYIALRQGDDIGYSPVEGEIETKLFLDFMQEASNSIRNFLIFQSDVYWYGIRMESKSKREREWNLQEKCCAISQALQKMAQEFQ